ncbi:arginine deiminase-related protein [Marinomonas sp. 15G1-11]|uniref:Arginine deiminase-related protein n=1 Tax=Marinomonas phaeophyticola TaxID=3004091 RepID=A0ABT4JQG9_9GAMM|nr:arginine deiminase-related protein [Marinomonas sp. 15G1-11]MCZ2720623.1 arginine deiminase-related protein [Marinomonas sp. 15G1-11]
MSVKQTQLSDTLVMVRPVDFGFNEQTGGDNAFQHKPDVGENVTEKALIEFQNMVDNLRSVGITTLVLEKGQHNKKTPDAIFPNNWFSTTASGTLLVYPMYAENRRQERRIDDLTELLEAHNYSVNDTQIVGDFNETQEILEGTGVLIFDHIHNRIFAAQSERCHPEQLDRFATKRGYQEVYLFQTTSSHGTPIYHTNVMMSVGDGFAVVCADSITDKEAYQTLKSALAIDREVIEISMEQTEKHFCANILHVKNDQGQPYIIMSQSAYNGFTSSQKAQLEKYGTLLPNPIETIEKIGGGSARCMIAEVFLPKKVL